MAVKTVVGHSLTPVCSVREGLTIRLWKVTNSLDNSLRCLRVSMGPVTNNSTRCNPFLALEVSLPTQDFKRSGYYALPRLVNGTSHDISFCTIVSFVISRMTGLKPAANEVYQL